MKAGVPELDFHEVEDVTRTADEEELHDEVVQGNPAPKQVQVASDKHHGI